MEENKTILLVEDNKHLNKINSRALTLSGYKVLTAMTLAEAREHLAKTEPAAIILDILLPDGNGVEFCREIREQTAAPILFLTSVAGVDQALEGIRAGGDDYLNKPFHIELLLARIEAFWRRDAIKQRMKPEGLMTVGPLTLNEVANVAYLRGEDLLLTTKEFALLRLLVQNEGRTISKEAIYEKVWGQAMGGDSQALYAVVSRLKKKMEPGKDSIRLLTVRPEGYLLSIKKTKNKVLSKEPTL
ncbi:response regulator transcription factor [Eubacteriales bacterium DFI.9.88]|nr:response regulator transcription factor [Eubacteriales bacterium DFI.9.88]